VPEATLDDRFAELRRLVDLKIAEARRSVISELSRALARMRAAQTEAEWNHAVLESGRLFANDPAALELLASLAALTVPALPPRAADASAQRFARVKIAEIQLYHAPAVHAGRAACDLYGSLQSQIDAARDAFRERFMNGSSDGPADYLHSEMLRVLANDDATLLGPRYPGPLV
jgi:hypothetical protein